MQPRASVAANEIPEAGAYARPAIEVPQCRGEAALEGFISRREPCVVRDLAAQWTALERWTLPQLREAGRGQFADVAPLARGKLGTQARTGVTTSRREMSEFIDGLMLGDKRSYLMTRLETLQGFTRDIETPQAPRNAGWKSSKLWISPDGAVSPLHFDVAHNLHVQVVGRKRFLLLPARDALRLYPYPPWSGTPNFSHVDPMQPDFARHPKAREVTRWVCELSPGDAVFIPGLVWHHVTTLETSVSVNFWWARGPRRIAASAADAWKRFRAVSR